LSRMKTLSIEDCMHLGWAGGYKRDKGFVSSDRYYAEIEDGLGVCVYIVGAGVVYSVQLFPLTSPCNLKESYIRHFMHITKLDGTGRDASKSQRALYPYFEAPDLLTLKAVAIEHADNWRKLKCST
jgi:hypothetical protein